MRTLLVIALGASIRLGSFVDAHLITSQATLPRARPTAYPGIGIGHDGLFGRFPGQQLYARNRVNCDNDGNMFCPTGTCYTDSTGLIGCCTVSSCVPRTICIEYTAGVTSACDPDTGGCLHCSDSASPSCFTFTNTQASQWIQYCNDYASTETVGYPNTVTGSIYQRDDDELSTTTDSNPGSQTFASATFKTQPCREEIPGATCPSTTLLKMSTSLAPETSYNSAGSSSSSSQGIFGISSASSGSVDATSTSIEESDATSSSLAGGPGAHSGKGSAIVSGGEVAGIACGSAAGVAVVALIFWWLWRRRRTGPLSTRSKNSSNSSSSVKKSPQQTATPTPGTAQLESWPVEVNGTTPQSRPQSPDFPFTPEHFAGCQPVSEVSEPGYGIQPQQRYTVMNPDPLSPVTPVTRVAPPTKWASQQGLNESESSLPISSVGLPGTPDSKLSARSPVSSLRPQTPKTRQTPYASSTYDGGNEPPSSVPRVANAAPPSLPQDYSIVNLGSSTDLYRGLSVRDDGARRPYPSP
ncbi:hypothetical protein EJ03DRAFT_346862 [Teratosphaeria nubilosa]|uniref:Uncharacterized protein n=1 Tax=Teratosphaeria nubilosa TaxID=161662 RepID=A0A6G1LN52_9PEZI|nr:hypothetical protein EJ03DRAFT_346862 [Teratosphaeria nubilosa]